MKFGGPGPGPGPEAQRVAPTVKDKYDPWGKNTQNTPRGIGVRGMFN